MTRKSFKSNFFSSPIRYCILKRWHVLVREVELILNFFYHSFDCDHLHIYYYLHHIPSHQNLPYCFSQFLSIICPSSIYQTYAILVLPMMHDSLVFFSLVVFKKNVINVMFLLVYWSVRIGRSSTRTLSSLQHEHDIKSTHLQDVIILYLYLY